MTRWLYTTIVICIYAYLTLKIAIFDAKQFVCAFHDKLDSMGIVKSDASELYRIDIRSPSRCKFNFI